MSKSTKYKCISIPCSSLVFQSSLRSNIKVTTEERNCTKLWLEVKLVPNQSTNQMEPQNFKQTGPWKKQTDSMMTSCALFCERFFCKSIISETEEIWEEIIHERGSGRQFFRRNRFFTKHKVINYWCFRCWIFKIFRIFRNRVARIRIFHTFLIKKTTQLISIQKWIVSFVSKQAGVAQ